MERTCQGFLEQEQWRRERAEADLKAQVAELQERVLLLETVS
jgi:hypothetical protein